jgi:hypothetical protein
VSGAFIIITIIIITIIVIIIIIIVIIIIITIIIMDLQPIVRPWSPFSSVSLHSR